MFIFDETGSLNIYKNWVKFDRMLKSDIRYDTNATSMQSLLTQNDSIILLV